MGTSRNQKRKQRSTGAIDARQAERLAERGIALLQEGSPERALPELERAYDRVREDWIQRGLVRAHRELADRELAKPRLAGAIEHLEEATALEPRWTEGHLMLGSLRLRTLDRDGAGAAFARALEVDPENTLARLSLALVSLHRGEPEHALASLGAPGTGSLEGGSWTTDDEERLENLQHLVILTASLMRGDIVGLRARFEGGISSVRERRLLEVVEKGHAAILEAWSREVTARFAAGLATLRGRMLEARSAGRRPEFPASDLETLLGGSGAPALPELASALATSFSQLPAPEEMSWVHRFYGWVLGAMARPGASGTADAGGEFPPATPVRIAALVALVDRLRRGEPFPEALVALGEAAADLPEAAMGWLLRDLADRTPGPDILLSFEPHFARRGRDLRALFAALVLRSGDPRRALAIWESMTDTTSTWVIFAAMAHEMLGDPETALDRWMDALRRMVAGEAGSREDAITGLLALVLEKTHDRGRCGDLKEVVEELLSRFPSDLELRRIVLAHRLRHGGEKGGGARSWTRPILDEARAMRAMPGKNVEDLLLLIRAFREAGELEAAFECVRQAMLEPGAPPEAAEIFEAMVERRAAERADPRAALRVLEEAAKSRRAGPRRQYLEWRLRRQAAKGREETPRHFLDAVRTSPEAALALTRLALDHQDRETAAACLAAAEPLSGLTPDGWRSAIELWIDLGDEDHAMRTLETFLTSSTEPAIQLIVTGKLLVVALQKSASRLADRTLEAIAALGATDLRLMSRVEALRRAPPDPTPRLGLAIEIATAIVELCRALMSGAENRPGLFSGADPASPPTSAPENRPGLFSAPDSDSHPPLTTPPHHPSPPPIPTDPTPSPSLPPGFSELQALAARHLDRAFHPDNAPASEKVEWDTVLLDGLKEILFDQYRTLTESWWTHRSASQGAVARASHSK